MTTFSGPLPSVQQNNHYGGPWSTPPPPQGAPAIRLPVTPLVADKPPRPIRGGLPMVAGDEVFTPTQGRHPIAPIARPSTGQRSQLKPPARGTPSCLPVQLRLQQHPSNTLVWWRGVTPAPQMPSGPAVAHRSTDFEGATPAPPVPIPHTAVWLPGNCRSTNPSLPTNCAPPTSAPIGEVFAQSMVLPDERYDVQARVNLPKPTKTHEQATNVARWASNGSAPEYNAVNGEQRAKETLVPSNQNEHSGAPAHRPIELKTYSDLPSKVFLHQIVEHATEELEWRYAPHVPPGAFIQQVIDLLNKHFDPFLHLSVLDVIRDFVETQEKTLRMCERDKGKPTDVANVDHCSETQPTLAAPPPPPQGTVNATARETVRAIIQRQRAARLAQIQAAAVTVPAISSIEPSEEQGHEEQQTEEATEAGTSSINESHGESDPMPELEFEEFEELAQTYEDSQNRSFGDYIPSPDNQGSDTLVGMSSREDTAAAESKDDVAAGREAEKLIGRALDRFVKIVQALFGGEAEDAGEGGGQMSEDDGGAASTQSSTGTMASQLSSDEAPQSGSGSRLTKRFQTSSTWSVDRARGRAGRLSEKGLRARLRRFYRETGKEFEHIRRIAAEQA